VPSNRHPRIWTFKPASQLKNQCQPHSPSRKRERASNSKHLVSISFFSQTSLSLHRCCSRFYQDQETNVWPEKSNLLAVRKKNTITLISFFLSLSKRGKESQVILFLFQTESNFALSGHTFVSWSWYYPRPSIHALLCSFCASAKERGVDLTHTKTQM